MSLHSWTRAATLDKERWNNGNIHLDYNPATEQFFLQNSLAGFWLDEDDMSDLVELLLELFEEQ